MQALRSIALAVAAAATPAAHAAFVTPAIGGDQVMGAQWMKHVWVDFDGVDLSLRVDDAVATPLLRPLSPPNAFDPSEDWAPLIGTAHNFQYGWLLGSLWAPPAGLGVFIEQLDASPALEVYAGGRFRNGGVNDMTFDPLFVGGEAWQWPAGLRMTHHAYAVRDPLEASYSATYRVYLADAVTGAEPIAAGGVPLFGSATVTLEWAAVPVPEPAGFAGVLGGVALLTVRARRAGGDA